MAQETGALLPSAQIAEEDQLSGKQKFPICRAVSIFIGIVFVLVLRHMFLSFEVADQDDVDAVDKELIELEFQIEGRVLMLLKDEELFADAIRVWRQDVTLNREPLAVIEVASEQDVIMALPVLTKLSQNYSIPFRIRSGGHSKAGYSTVPGGIVLSLKNLQMVALHDDDDHVANTTTNTTTTAAAATTHKVVVATVQPGATVETVLDHLLLEQDTSGSMGMCGRVAEGGWVLGGGIGFMTRSLGLGIDNVLSFNVVLYNGTLVTANATSHEELFFALRGAGSGNYGVVTSMEYKFIHPMPKKQLDGVLEMPLSEFPYFVFQLGKNPPSREFMMVLFLERSENKQFTAGGVMSWFSPDPTILAKGKERFEQEIAPLLTSNKTVPYHEFDWATMTHRMLDGPGYSTSVFADQVWQGFFDARKQYTGGLE